MSDEDEALPLPADPPIQGKQQQTLVRNLIAESEDILETLMKTNEFKSRTLEAKELPGMNAKPTFIEVRTVIQLPDLFEASTDLLWRC